ncbi:APC family permease [Legionella hackeliae]|uniref:Amino acid permease family protein n=1 Tax=Legionella hackeliae TaxID=449 RepID=A0A0A8UY80_LEGHA|nr:APC family permease [Legionella hackeliae]KTD09984.1 Amino acid permease family protein [Legionella hackeliae]CEK11714.1 Amino acid permease family protein [Legionella hackeliae]STX48484.1 amino acid transporters [Legionella hackeliae]
MLKRDISRTNVLIAAAGGMIGSGWLFSPFISAQMAGSNALISWIIAALFMLFIALPLCELGAMFPISGGMTNYPSFTHGNDVGFLFAWTSWLSYVVMTPIEIQAILQYSSHFFPTLIVKDASAFTLSGIGYVVAMGIMLFVVLLNSYGIKLLAECNKFASIIKFLVPSIAIVALLSSTSSMSNISLNLTTKEAWVQIFTALSAGGVAFAFTGFQNGLMLAGEVQNPQRNIPIAILGAVLVGFVLYFMLQLSFLAAIPQSYLTHGWQQLSFPGDSGPLVGLTLLVGLGFVAMLLMFDAAFSPFGTTLVYTAATSRILYGMALNKHLPKFFLKLNRHKIPYITLYANLLVGILSFLPFPGWQKMVAFLSSCSILSYGIGPICLLAMRQLQPNRERPFKLWAGMFFCHIAFYVCNLMLYWCGFDILWKLNLALFLGFIINLIYQKRRLTDCSPSLYWFAFYMISMLGVSYVGSFGGIGGLQFPLDIILILPLSIILLQLSQRVLIDSKAHEQLTANMDLVEN